MWSQRAYGASLILTKSMLPLAKPPPPAGRISDGVIMGFDWGNERDIN